MTAKPFIRRIYTGDNLPVLRSMDSETADLIYLDPPFNSGKQWENPVEAGGRRALASFKDTWELSDSHPDEEYALGQQYPAAIPLIDSLHAINGGSWRAYLIYMGVRLAEMRRILKTGGSIFYHCDQVMSHGIKLLMDAVFGGSNGGRFCNEIVWCYTTPTSPKIKRFPNHTDSIFWYAKGKSWCFNRDDVRVPYKGKGPHGGKAWLKDGENLAEWREARNKAGKVPSNWCEIPKAVYSKENIGYPTQKPLALLERIVKASSNAGDLVIDPFCGCATTCHAAEVLGRQWIGIDFAEEAATLVVARLQKESDKQLKPSFDDIEHIVVQGRRGLPARTDLPKRTEAAVLKPRLFKMQNGKCAAPCGENGEGRALPIDAMDFDHIIARSRGGQDTDDNLQLLCGNCNTTKGARGMDYLRRRILQRRAKETMELWRKKWEARKDKMDAPRAD